MRVRAFLWRYYEKERVIKEVYLSCFYGPILLHRTLGLVNAL